MTRGQSIGDVVQARRKAVGVSQDYLAWASRVSRNTIGNLERNQGEPERRVVCNVYAALGLDWEYVSSAHLDREFLPLPAVSRVLNIISDIRNSDPEQARKLMDIYIAYVNTEIEMRGILGDAQSIDSPWLKTFIHGFAPYLSPSNPEDLSVLEALTDRGWSPEDTPNLGSMVGELERVAQGRFDFGPPRTAASPAFEDQIKRESLAKVEDLRRELHESAQINKQLQAAYAKDHRELSNALMRMEGMQHALDTAKRRNAELEHLMHGIIGRESGNAEAFARLPAAVQDELQEGHIVDFSVIPSARIPEVRHVLLTLKSPATHVPVSDLADATIQMLVSQHIAGAIAGQLEKSDWPTSPYLLLSAIGYALQASGYHELGVAIERIIANLGPGETG